MNKPVHLNLKASSETSSKAVSIAKPKENPEGNPEARPKITITPGPKPKASSSEEVKNLLFKTKKNPIKNNAVSGNDKDADNKNTDKLVGEKNSFEFKKITNNELTHFIIINFLYAEEMGITDWNYLFKAFKKLLSVQQKRYITNELLEEITDFCKRIIQKKNDYDLLISQNLVGWEMERISYIKKVILRWGICLLKPDDENNFKQNFSSFSLPHNKVFLLGINFSKYFGEKKDYAFINAVLNRIYKEGNYKEGDSKKDDEKENKIGLKKL